MSQPPLPVRFADLGVRILSAVVLIALALLAFWGDIAFAVALVAVAVGLMLWEYRRLVLGRVSLREPALWIMVAAGAGAVAATGAASLWLAVVPLTAGAALLWWLDRAHWRWMAPGLWYIAFALSVLIDMRRADVTGFESVVWLILVVMAADVGGYFAGRILGGPKLWPAVSPKKTWAGILGGLALAVLVAVVFRLGGWKDDVPALVAVSLAVALASQAGDLLESAVKRHFGVKDSSRLIPGHGGLLDRFDGLLGGLLMVSLLDRLNLLGG